MHYFIFAAAWWNKNNKYNKKMEISSFLQNVNEDKKCILNF